MRYLVIKDNFLWKKGAVLKKSIMPDVDGYIAVDGLFTLPHTKTEWISSQIIENNPEWFEPIEDTIWEKFAEKVEEAKCELIRKMRLEWREHNGKN